MFRNAGWVVVDHPVCTEQGCFATFFITAHPPLLTRRGISPIPSSSLTPLQQPLWQALPLKELPHHLGGVDFLSSPGVAQAINADHSDFDAVTATRVAHCRQGSRRIFQNDFGIAAIVTGPA